jgi:hypothetical protein
MAHKEALEMALFEDLVTLLITVDVDKAELLNYGMLLSLVS